MLWPLLIPTLLCYFELSIKDYYYFIFFTFRSILSTFMTNSGFWGSSFFFQEHCIFSSFLYLSPEIITLADLFWMSHPQKKKKINAYFFYMLEQWLPTMLVFWLLNQCVYYGNNMQKNNNKYENSDNRQISKPYPIWCLKYLVKVG